MERTGARKIFVSLLIFTLLLSGCSTYRFSRGKPPYDKGYVASRDDNTILEYTVGKDNTVPNVKLAKERFKRRKRTVEHYYKKMGYIDDYFRITFADPIISIVRVVGGIPLLPYFLVSDYRYDHDPEYRKRIIRLEEQKDAFEEARINKIKAELREYIEEDLAREEGRPIVKEKQKKEKLPKPVKIKKKKAKVTKEEPLKPVEVIEKTPEVTKEKPKKAKKEPVQGEFTAVITARPVRGISPLKVRFNANKSHSPKGRIVSYLWDFGDGDTSTKVNPTNTYWSGSYLAKELTVTLAVTDDKGNTAKDTVVIEVANR